MSRIYVILLLCVPVCLSAQSYTTAFGIRISTDVGLSVNQRIFKHTTLEGIVESKLQAKEIGIGLMIKQHQRLITRRFNVFIGAGYTKYFNQNFSSEVLLPEGPAAMAGAEITLGRLNIAWDFKAEYQLYGVEEPTFVGQTALTLRYVLIRRKRKRFKWKFWEK